jgi:hypothetical protein
LEPNSENFSKEEDKSEDKEKWIWNILYSKT